MKEHPVIFSAPMVRAILDGRKTQTRRVFKVPGVAGGQFAITSPDEEIIRFDDGTFHYASTAALSGPYPCPYGQLGDRLWVRETWTWTGASSTSPPETPRAAGAWDKLYVTYAADGCARTIETGGKVLPLPQQPPQREGEEYCLRDAPADFVYTGDNTYVDRLGQWWKRKIPAIHMPRWASRILLEVTDVRVQRLQDISEADALAEGCHSQIKHSAAFADLWDLINAKRGFGWDANPWVWVLTFKRMTEAVDE